VQIEAFDSMRQTVESLASGDSLFLANWQFRPSLTPLSSPPTGEQWIDLLSRKAREGVRIRVIISDLPAAAGGLRTDLTPVHDAIAGLPGDVRGNWKFISSPHESPVATHHQKIMIATKGGSVTAYCGGLDISNNRIPTPNGTFVWHDVHARLEGL